MSTTFGNDALQQELHNLTVNSKRRNNRRIRMALIIAALIAVLSLKTQWPSLQPGLYILLAGQLIFAGFLVLRNRRITEHIPVDRWFDEELAVNRQAAWLENGPRMLGFAVLAFGFWRATGNVLVSVALGVVYPAILLWGLSRVTGRQAAKRYQTERARLHALRDKSSFEA